MYQPPHFRVEGRERLLGVIRAHPLADLVTAGPGGLMANPVPMLAVEEGGRLLLRAHLARANPQTREIAAGAPLLAIFRGVEGYVSPSWYATKAETHKVVPTWNYVVVQARGTARLDESPGWLHAQIGALTAAQEAGRPQPWAVGDAPEDFIAMQMRAIVGVEVEVTELTGKFKLSQNRPEADRAGVRAGLAATGRPEDAALAALIP